MRLGLTATRVFFLKKTFLGCLERLVNPTDQKLSLQGSTALRYFLET